MPKVDSIPVGAPIWMDLSTSDLDRAEAFYGALFGWSVERGPQDEFGGYSTAMLGDRRVAGMMPKWNDPEAGEMPDAWTVYLHTADSAATLAAVSANGGQAIVEPMAVGPFGIMSVFVDPAGAVFGTWQPDQHDGYQVFGEHGAPAWFELMSLDIEATSAFYPAVFGGTLKDMEMEGPSYRTLNINGEDMAGMMDAKGLMPEGVPSNWIIYFGVDDVDAAAAQAVELGGSIAVPLTDTAWGRFTVLADPMGAHFAIIGVDGGV